MNSSGKITAEAIFTYLREKHGVDTTGLTEQSELFSSGVLDSFSLVELIMFLEGQAEIRISPMDVNLDNLDTVERMLAFVSRLQQS